MSLDFKKIDTNSNNIITIHLGIFVSRLKSLVSVDFKKNCLIIYKAMRAGRIYNKCNSIIVFIQKYYYN